MKHGFPETHYGGFASEADWEELLPARRFGDHPPWYGDAATHESHKGQVALIPWLLFNRHLWAARAEELPIGVEDLNVLVPRAGSDGVQEEGWFVTLKISEDEEILGLEAVDMDDESAPSSEGFYQLLPGTPPPAVAAPARIRRVRRWIASAVLIACSGLLATLAGLVFGVSSEQEMRYSALQSDLWALQAQESALRAEWNAKQELGLSSRRAAQILMDAIWFDAQVELQGQEVRWLGENGQPLGLNCDPPETEGPGAGWSSCQWEEV